MTLEVLRVVDKIRIVTGPRRTTSVVDAPGRTWWTVAIAFCDRDGRGEDMEIKKGTTSEAD